MQSGGSGAGGKAAGGRTSRPGGGIGGTPAARRTPYGRPQSGIEAGGTSRASGLATPGLPPAGHRDLDVEYKGGQPTPGNFAAPEPAGTPSTISRFLTPIKAAGGYFFGSVSICPHPNIGELFRPTCMIESLIHMRCACAGWIQVGTLLGAGSSPGVLSNSPGESPVPPSAYQITSGTSSLLLLSIWSGNMMGFLLTLLLVCCRDGRRCPGRRCRYGSEPEHCC